MQEMTLKPLGQVKELVESLGMEISYAYEDLVFLQHNGFLLQFDDGNGAEQVADDQQFPAVA
jgi:DNA-binding IclR family transcriptional regulator